MTLFEIRKHTKIHQMIHYQEFKIKFNPSQVINEKSLGIYRNLYYELRHQSWMKYQFASQF
jgi:hypothetical protein